MKHYLKYIAFAIAMIGAINWGVIGFFDFNIISYFLGEESVICRIVYALIGACGLYSASYAVIECKCDFPQNSNN